MLAKTTEFTIPQGLLLQVAGTFRTPEPIAKVRAAVAALEPRDELEAMLIVQMIGCTNLAMRWMDRAMKVRDNIDFMQQYTNIAAKLMRTYAIQVETLKRHRDGWGQKMTIERVNVESGGQAAFGSISHGKSGD